jgi:hypothetical protein
MLEEVGENLIMEFKICYLQYCWHDHIEEGEMGTPRNAYKILVRNPEGTRLLGRSRLK